MARLWSCGFELQSATSGVEGGNINQSGASISTATYRSGAASLKIAPSNASGQCWDTQITSGNILYIRTYVYFVSIPNAANNNLFQLYLNASGGSINIDITNGGIVSLYAIASGDASGTKIGNSSSALSTGQWYRFELYANVSANPWSFELRINGSTIATGTYAKAATSFDVWSLNVTGFSETTLTYSNTTGEVYFDDIAINSNSGSYQNSWPGIGSIIHLTPNAAGDANSWQDNAGGAGTSNNYALVNELPLETVDYIQSTTLNNEDLYNVSAMPGSIASVACVHVGYRFRRASTSTCARFKAEIEKTSGGTILQGTEITPNSTTIRTNKTASPFSYQLTAYQDPDNNNWTDSTLGTMQIGVKVTTDNTDTIRIYYIWALVDYVPLITATGLLDGKIIIKKSTTDLLDGLAEIIAGATDTNLLDGKVILKNAGTKLVDGLLKVKSVATKLLDGKIRLKSTAVKLLDGLVKIKNVAVNNLDGLVDIKSGATILLDGLVYLYKEVVNLLDGKIKVILKSTDNLDGKIVIGSKDVDSLDGKVIVKTIETLNLDGLVKILNKKEDKVDGKIIIKDSEAVILDGKLIVKNAVVDSLDGLVLVKNIAVNLADGKVIIKDSEVINLDGKVKVKNADTDLLDGKVLIKKNVSGLVDGKIVVKNVTILNLDGKVIVEDLIVSKVDGKIKIKSSTIKLLDGKVDVKDSLINLLDAKVIIASSALATKLLDGLLRIKDSIISLLSGKLILTPLVTGRLKRWDGHNWITAQMQRWDGHSWVLANGYYFNGFNWINF